MPSTTQFLADVLNQISTNGMGVWDFFLSILIAYFGGILSSLTPCVYPMIPITVSVIGGMGGSTPKARKPWHAVGVRGAWYVVGMTVVYSFLGVLAGISGKVFGSFTNKSGWYLSLGLVMSFAALMMLDVIQMDPIVLWEKIKRTALRLANGKFHSSPHSHRFKEMNWIGAFFLGASSGFIAAPCTTPVLTGILAYIAKSQSVALGFFLMFAFSLGLGTLLLAVAVFAGAIQLLPRSGHWMKTVKTVSGLILLAFAEYLIYRAGSLGGP